jgi:exosortase/archaeosortase family protein
MLSSLRPLNTRFAAARGFPLRAAAIIGLVLIAYNYSLLTLARGLGLQTPLAYLALVPLIAVGLAVARLRLEPRQLPIHDRQVDWIVGLGLLGVASAVLILVPDPTTSTFWLQRLDLLTLPLFVGGLIALLFGVRRMWSMKGPLAFLLLAWPVPYNLFLASASGWFTDLTAGLVAALTRIVPIAKVAPADNTLYFVGSGSQGFSLSISSACAGVNSLVGFLLIGTAMLFIVRGPLVRRGLWLAVGLAIIFLLNLVRIVGILIVGAVFGQGAAIDVLHPVAGLLIFNLGVVAMILLVPRFGLRFIGSSDRPGPDGQVSTSPVKRVRPALAVGMVVALVLGLTNAAYARYEAISSGLADARLESFDVRDLALPAWQSRYISAFPQAKQYFGGSATWDRATYWSTPAASLTASRSVYVDVITTDDPGSFAAYGLQACYRFHGYTIASVTTADIGAGVHAQLIDYVNTKVKADWSALAWEWPYTENGKTRYERVVILINEGPQTKFAGLAADDVTSQVPRFAETDQFLVTLARTIVKSQLQTTAAAR